MENGDRTAPRSYEADAASALLAAQVSGPSPSADVPVVVLVHGITANAMTWPPTMRRLGAAASAVAVDLRGRGASRELGPPYGIRTHADDLARLLDQFGVGRAVLVGHSMGAYVTTTFAERHPDRLVAAVLVDGGLTIDPPASDPDTAIEEVLGPALARLRQTFASRHEYRHFWRRHPAFGDTWNDDIERYIGHDLIGVTPRLRSRVVEDAVRVDGAEILFDRDVITAVERVCVPVELVRVERGLLGEPSPLIPHDVADAAAAANPRLTVTTVPELNHYTIVLAPAGADAVAAAVGRALSSWR